MSREDLVLKRTILRSSSSSHTMLSMATRKVFPWLRFVLYKSGRVWRRSLY